MIDQGLRCRHRNPQYAYVAPSYKQAKMVAWEYFIFHTKDLPGVEVNKSELSVSIPRPNKGDKIKFMLLGAENPDSLRGIYLDGCVLDEYAQQPSSIWGEVVRPALSDRKGWAIFIGTPKGRNNFYELYKMAQGIPGWFTAMYKASETGIVDEEELEDARATMSEAEYLQEYEVDFQAALTGSFYGKIMGEIRNNGRIASVPYDPSVPVDTYWDLGIGDTTAIWFRQRVGADIHYIDYIEAGGESLAYYAKLVKEKDYAYGRHILPHDGAARDLGTGMTRQETMRKLGIRTEIQKRQAVDDRIQAARLILPRSRFDSEKCARGLECLTNYQREWDSKLMMFKNKPKHDWASNGADAYGYSALDNRKSDFAEDFGKDLPRQSVMDYDDGGF
jgi:hypothetical protein